MIVAGSAANIAAAVAVDLPGPAARPKLEAEAVTENEVGLGDEVEAAQMMKVAAVLVLLAEGQLAFDIGNTVDRLAVHNAADKGHSQGTFDSAAGIAIVVAGTIVEASDPVPQLVHRQLD